MIQSILSNLAVILLGHLVITTLVSYRNHISIKVLWTSIILIESAVVVSMLYLPIMIGEFRFDLRLIPLIMLAVFNGWRTTLPVLAIAVAWRVSMGGEGALPGTVFGMMLPAFFALAYAKWKGRSLKEFEMVLLISCCWVLSDIPIIVMHPESVEALRKIILVRYPAFIVVAFTYYSFIRLEFKRQAMKAQLRFLATHDQLTHLLNKNECIRLAEVKIKSSRHEHFIAMLDLDHFKRLNDRFGHMAGDEALIQLAHILRSFQGEHVLPARYGGEEFMFYIGAKNYDEAIGLIEKLQGKIRAAEFRIQGDVSIPVTVSIGIARWDQDASIQDAIKEADRQLYKAKARGRNQLSVSGR